MNDLIDILRFHQKHYPLMQPQDVFKLVYQNEFGGGHLIADDKQSLAWIKKEYASINHQDEELLTPIGNQIVRVSLHAYKGSLEELNELFVRSSHMITGNKEQFLAKIKQIKTWIEEDNIFTFSKEEFNKFYNEYIHLDCPLVSHSKIYKENYNPSYRVISNKLLLKD